MAISVCNHLKKTIALFGAAKITAAAAEVFKGEIHGTNENVIKLAKLGRLTEALHILYDAEKPPDNFAYVCLLQGCINKKALSEGKLVHTHLNMNMHMPGISLYNVLINMYAKCGSLGDARSVFDQMPERNVISWNTIIAAYCRLGDAEEALNLFRQMLEQVESVQPDEFTFASVLAACAAMGTMQQGMEIHGNVIREGFQSDAFIDSALVDMYAKCGSIEDACDVFDQMRQRDVVSWNALIAGYAQNGHVSEALRLFRQMPQRDVVSWNAMIAGFVQNGGCVEGLKLFQEMQLAGVRSNSNSFASVLPACTAMVALQCGMEIHGDVIRSGLEFDVFVEGALVDMYAKCGSIEQARNVFDKMRQRDVVCWNTIISGYAQNGFVDEALRLFEEMVERDVASWTAIIAGYAQNGQPMEALSFFQQMQQAGVKPDQKTFASVISACANLAALRQGAEIHRDVIKSGFQYAVVVEGALVDMYAKCGSIEKARAVFDKMQQRDIVSWNTMIAGYAMHGCGKDALNIFEQMEQSGMNPNHVTFICVLSACCHAGLMKEGLQYFDCIKQHYSIKPVMEHYVCVVDLLGRAGCLDKAKNFIINMPIKPDETLWRCLLGVCRIHGNIELGEYAAECLLQLDPSDAATYVLLSNIYAAVGRWDDTENVRRMMKDRDIKKTPGCSWIEVNKQVHAFLVGDK